MAVTLQIFIACVLFGVSLGSTIMIPTSTQRMQRRTVSTVSAGDIQVILEEHNKFRAAVSPKASDMRKMYWSEGLADAAQGWADQCIRGHDENFPRRLAANIGAPVGQNYAENYSWAKAVAAWHSEVQFFDYATLASTTPGEAVGHYTQVVWSESSLVGCGFKECSGKQVYICNYAFGNMRGQAPYIKGQPCDSCPGKCVDGSLCDCPAGMICKNGGIIDLATCTCTCKNGFTGAQCEICPIFDKDRSCGSFFGKDKCAKWSNVPSSCPVMCGICPDTCGNPMKNVNYCKFGGVLKDDCKCKCASGYSGEDCSTVENCADNWYCDQWPSEYCSLYTNVPTLCPKMCAVC